MCKLCNSGEEDPEHCSYTSLWIAIHYMEELTVRKVREGGGIVIKVVWGVTPKLVETENGSYRVSCLNILKSVHNMFNGTTCL